ncbi:MAG: hypothetical protein GY868_15050 [Deltaproteobacteria bacterium]|nr:hypothetical protein [Deltaproteobacteria bacterium]
MDKTPEDMEVINDFCAEIEELLSDVDTQIEVMQQFVYYQPFEVNDYIAFMQDLNVPEYLEAMRGINRFVHTLKGTSAFMDLMQLNKYCHIFEELTIDLAGGKSFLGPEAFAIIQQLPSIVTRLFGKIKEEYSDENVSIETEVEEIKACQQQVHDLMKGEHVELETIQKKDFGVARQSKKNIKMSLDLAVHDDIVQNFQALTSDLARLLEANAVESESSFQITDAMNQHLDSLIISAQSQIVLKRYQRIVSDLGRSLEKNIAFVVKRNEAFARPDVWDRCHNALVHLVRNAVDHGVDTPAEREKLGKVAQGKIELDIYEDHKNIYIALIDDGRGIDEKKIGQMALEKGVVTEQELSRMDRESIQMLIFKPNFSTKAQATDISGRGVGMDAVIKEIEDNLNGRVRLNSEINVGTTIFIEIPKSESLTECILFGDEDYTYAIPRVADIEYIDCERRYVEQVFGENPIYSKGDKSIPLLPVLELLHPEEYCGKKYDYCTIIKTGSNGSGFGLVVPKIYGHRLIKIESRKTVKKLFDDRGVVYGFGLTDPITVVLDLDYLHAKI